MHNKNKILLLASLLFASPAFATEGPFTEQELREKFRSIMFGINKEYTGEPAAARPEGCVTFEIRIQRDGIASWFRVKEGSFDNHALLKRIETAVLNRFDMARDRLQEPQLALHTLCFDRAKGVTSKDLASAPPPPPPKKAEEMMEHERNGVSNRAWLEQLMATEGQPVEAAETVTKSVPQGTLVQP